MTFLWNKLALVLVMQSFALLAQTTYKSFVFDLPKRDTTTSAQLKCWGTLYFIHEMTSGKGNIPFLSKQGKPLGFSADTCDFCLAALEGTVLVKDASGRSTVLNFETYGDSSVVDCKQCKRFAQSKLEVHKWGKKRWFVSSGLGNGVKGYHLIPFRTVAVDPKLIPYGSVLYIPKARGLSIILPNGTKAVHDGYFFAGDGGSAIIGNHIDFFIGVAKTNPFKQFVKSTPEEQFQTYLVSDMTIVKAMQGLHTGRLP